MMEKNGSAFLTEQEKEQLKKPLEKKASKESPIPERYRGHYTLEELKKLK